MKKLLAIIILSLCFITPSQADDIRDFQIEGMSVGDSLLDYFSDKATKEKNWWDKLRVEILEEEFKNFVFYEAFK